MKESVGYRMVILTFFQNLESYNFACHHVDLQEADSTDDMNRYQSMKKKIADITKLKRLTQIRKGEINIIDNY